MARCDVLLLVALGVVCGSSALNWPGDKVICKEVKHITEIRQTSVRVPYVKVEEETVAKPCPLTKLRVIMYERIGRAIPDECDESKDPEYITQNVTKTYYKSAQKWEAVKGKAYCDREDTKCVSGYVVSQDGNSCERPRPITTESMEKTTVADGTTRSRSSGSGGRNQWRNTGSGSGRHNQWRDTAKELVHKAADFAKSIFSKSIFSIG